jgi:hypothetical protein
MKKGNPMNWTALESCSTAQFEHRLQQLGSGICSKLNTSMAGELVELTAVRLSVEENQLVNGFGKFGIWLGSLKSA